VRQFQKSRKLKVDGIVGKRTFAELVAPMAHVLQDIPPGNRTVGQMVVVYAKRHLEKHPVEVGGQNKGPWVRLYMNGNEGDEWPWCAGFVSFVLKQACKNLAVPLPLGTSVSCDTLAANAKAKGRFLPESKATDRRQIKPGSLFLNRRTSTDWVHTGIVVQAEDEYFVTIEGNTNDEGSREGYEVCRRTRGYKKKDFVLI
jgi:hypothetical protein